MTDLLTLTWASDNEADQDTFNLLDFAQGFTLPEGGWIPQTMSDGQITCTETITFYMQGTSHDSIAGFIQVLDDWKRKIAWSNDQTQRRVVWLNARWKTETNTRRAMVWSLNYSLGSSPFSPYLRESNFMPTFTIVIERGWWEELVYHADQTDEFSANGGTDSIGGTVTGDVSARIRQAISVFDSPTAARYLWLGFRTASQGVPANFVPNWELESSTYLLATSSDTTVVVDATASAGNKITTTFASSAALTARFGIRASDVSPGNPEDQCGIFKCLLRAKMSDASIARVRVSSGFVGNSASSQNKNIVNTRVNIVGTSWMLYDMGTIRLPPFERKFGISGLETYMGVIGEAERISGSGNLEMDELILIPLEYGFVSIDALANTGSVTVYVNPNEVTEANGENTFNQVELSNRNWGFPIDSTVLVVGAASGASSHSLAMKIQLAINYVRRWRTLRGTE